MGQYDIVIWRGEPITLRQRQAFLAAEKAIRARYPNFEFLIPQGSNQPSTVYSGYTHTKLGVADLQYPGFFGDVGYSTPAEQYKARFVLRALREVGCQAAQMRGPWNGMIYHYHVCDLDTHGMHPDAVWQVGQYRLGFNGLDAGVKDRFPFRPDPIRKWRYEA